MNQILTEEVVFGGQKYVVRELSGSEYMYFANHPQFKTASPEQLATHQLLKCIDVHDDNKVRKITEEQFKALPNRLITKLNLAFGRLNAPQESIVPAAAKVLLNLAPPPEVIEWLEKQTVLVAETPLTNGLETALLET